MGCARQAECRYPDPGHGSHVAGWRAGFSGGVGARFTMGTPGAGEKALQNCLGATCGQGPKNNKMVVAAGGGGLMHQVAAVAGGPTTGFTTVGWAHVHY